MLVNRTLWETGPDLHASVLNGPFLRGFGDSPCERFQTRAPNGELSEPTDICRDDVAVTETTTTDITCAADGLHLGAPEPEDTPAVATTDGDDRVLPTESSGGCSVAAPHGAGSTASAVVLLGALVLGRRRARRR